MCNVYSITPIESSYTQVGLLPVLEILHIPLVFLPLTANFKEKLVLNEGIPLLSIDHQCKGSPSPPVNCDLITLSVDI